MFDQHIVVKVPHTFVEPYFQQVEDSTWRWYDERMKAYVVLGQIPAKAESKTYQDMSNDRIPDVNKRAEFWDFVYNNVSGFFGNSPELNVKIVVLASNQAGRDNHWSMIGQLYMRDARCIPASVNFCSFFDQYKGCLPYSVSYFDQDTMIVYRHKRISFLHTVSGVGVVTCQHYRKEKV